VTSVFEVNCIVDDANLPVHSVAPEAARDRRDGRASRAHRPGERPT